MNWQLNSQKQTYYLAHQLSESDDLAPLLEFIAREAIKTGQRRFSLSWNQPTLTVVVGTGRASQGFRDSVRARLEAEPAPPSAVGFKLYCDGGARGNPGQAASGFVILNHLEQPVCQGGDYLGQATNNQAEYESLRRGLERAVSLGVKSLQAYMDSQLVVRQVKGEYRVKNPDLKERHRAILDLIAQMEYFTISHIPRELNRIADAIVNQVLDNNS